MSDAAVRDEQLIRMRDSVAWVGRLSDGLVRLGPLSLGVDGALSWIPGLGEVYSTAAGAFILIQGVRAGVPVPILALAGGLMLSRTAVSAIPLAGPVAADLFMAHRWSAQMVVRAIDWKLARAQASARPQRTRTLEPARLASR